MLVSGQQDLYHKSERKSRELSPARVGEMKCRHPADFRFQLRGCIFVILVLGLVQRRERVHSVKPRIT